MAKLNSPRRLIEEDFPAKYRDFTSGFFYILNGFIESVSFIFNKQLNFNDNFQAMDVEISVIGGATNTAIKNTLPVPVRGATVLRVDPLDTPTEMLAQAPFVQFTNGDSQIIINNVTGLQSGKRYRLRVVFFQ